MCIINISKFPFSEALFSKNIRAKWTNEERDVVSERFGNLKTLAVLPTLKECQALINERKWNRTAEQLKTWIDNQRKADIRKKQYAQRKMME